VPKQGVLGEIVMPGRDRRSISVLLAGLLLCVGSVPVLAADPDIDQLLKSPVGKATDAQKR
jgi:hypothetical protein